MEPRLSLSQASLVGKSSWIVKQVPIDADGQIQRKALLRAEQQSLTAVISIRTSQVSTRAFAHPGGSMRCPHGAISTSETNLRE